MKRLLLPLDLQFFAEEPPVVPAEPTPPNEPQEPEAPKYTQQDIDRIVGERLAREKAKSDKAVEEAKAEAERKKLEESNEFKALYEAEKQAREQVERERHAERLQTTKQSLLLSAGYASDKIADLMDFVTGDDEESAKASVEKLVKVAPPKAPPVDPSYNGGQRQAPQQNDGGYEAAREKARKILKRK